MNRSTTVTDLEEQRKEIDKSIEQIQSECSHKSSSIRNILTGSQFNLKMVCNDCNLELRYPTQIEVDEYLG